MRARLIMAIISTLLEEIALVAIVLLALPEIGVNISLPGLIALMVVWGAYSVIIYRVGSRALKRKPVVSLPDMVDSTGKVISPLVLEGLVKIKGELWVARSAESNIDVGVKVVVVEQDGLKLVVQRSDNAQNSDKA
ncbi:NfeD family protein [Chloroflexota bacterium]